VCLHLWHVSHQAVAFGDLSGTLLLGFCVDECGAGRSDHVRPTSRLWIIWFSSTPGFWTANSQQETRVVELIAYGKPKRRRGREWDHGKHLVDWSLEKASQLTAIVYGCQHEQLAMSLASRAPICVPPLVGSYGLPCYIRQGTLFPPNSTQTYAADIMYVLLGVSRVGAKDLIRPRPRATSLMPNRQLLQRDSSHRLYDRHPHSLVRSNTAALLSSGTTGVPSRRSD
jgi:hypothetical protein